MAFKKKTKKEEHEAQAATEVVSGLQVGNVVAEIGTLQVDVQNTLAALTATITNKLAQVEQIDKAIGLKQGELQELYSIEKEAMSLEALKAQREADAESWAKRAREENERFNEEVQQRAKEWAREEEEHKYTLKIRNERANEDYNTLLTRHHREEAIRQETLNREWTAREAALKAQEAEVAEFKRLVAEFDTRLKAEASKAEGIVTSRLNKQHEQEMLLLKKDMDAAKMLHDAELKSNQAAIANMTAQIAQLSRDLDRARQDAKEVTSQALAATSDRKVAEALNGVVQSQGQSGKSK